MSGVPDAIKKPLSGPPKEGKVAQITRPDEVVLNFGSSSGVVVGTRYRIVVLVDVPDPDDPSVKLATLQYVKANLEVTHVLEKVCVAKNAASTLSFMTRGIPEFPSPAPLNVDMAQIALPPEQLMIRIGDVVLLTPRLAPPKN